jgi:hypothetical protein
LSGKMEKRVQCPTCGRETPDASFCQYCGKGLYSCKKCKTLVLKETIYCPTCGILVSAENREMMAREHVSWAWWLLPILSIPGFNFVGGIIAWAFNRYRNPRKATLMLWLGVSITLIYFIVVAILQYTGNWGPVQ